MLNNNNVDFKILARYGSGSALNYLLKEKAGRGNQKCLLLKPRVPKIGGTPEMFAHVIAD